MSLTVDYLAEIGLLDYESLHEFITSSEVKEINGLVLYLRDLIDKDYIQHSYTPYTFVPNDDISGSGGCDETTCKIKRANNFAIFSALYADKSYIQLSFITSEHYELHDMDEIEYSFDMLYDYMIQVENDIALIISYFELMKANIIYITPTRKMLCKNCFQRDIFNNTNAIDMNKLKKEYSAKAAVVLQDLDKKNGCADIIIENIQEFFPDHNLITTVTNVETLALLSKEKVGSIIKNKEFSNIFVNKFIEEEIIKACYITKYCQEQNAKLITNKLSDSMFLGMNSNYKNIKQLEDHNNLLPEYIMPLISQLDISDVIHLREEEHESFNKYRIALNKAILEQLKSESESDWRKIYDNIIFPELNNLDLKLKQLKNGRMNRIFGTMIVVGSAIVASKYGNLIKPDIFGSIPNVSKAVGLTVGSAGINGVLDRESTKKANLQDNDYFFLWKLTQKK